MESLRRTEMRNLSQPIDGPEVPEAGDPSQRSDEAAQRVLQDLRAVHRTGLRLQQLHPPAVLAQEIIRILEETLDYEYGAVLLLEQDTGSLIPFALSDQGHGSEFIQQDKAYISSHQVRLGVGITGWVVEHGESARVGDVQQDPRYYGIRSDIHSELCVPLRIGDKVLGAVNVETGQLDAYSENDQRVLEIVASQIAVAIVNARLFEAIQEQSRQLRTELVMRKLAEQTLRELNWQLAEAQEIERKKLARELHDRVGRNLTALDLYLNTIRGQLLAAKPSISEIRTRMDASLALLTETAERIRDVMAGLRPPALDDCGLVAALQSLAAQCEADYGITVTVEGREPEPRLSPAAELALYRIAQEALNNVFKHAHASRANVMLEPGQPGGVCRLSVADDGIGFEMAQAKNPLTQRHWGLVMMAERAEAVGGHCRVESSPGKGTRVSVELRI